MTASCRNRPPHAAIAYAAKLGADVDAVFESHRNPATVLAAMGEAAHVGERSSPRPSANGCGTGCVPSSRPHPSRFTGSISGGIRPMHSSPTPARVDADLVVVGSRGCRDLASLILGSTRAMHRQPFFVRPSSSCRHRKEERNVKVRDLMTTNPVTTTPDTPAQRGGAPHGEAQRERLTRREGRWQGCRHRHRRDFLRQSNRDRPYRFSLLRRLLRRSAGHRPSAETTSVR